MAETMIHLSYSKDMFDTDRIRADLAKGQDYDALRTTYTSKDFLDIPGMNTAEKWDGLATFDYLPPHRVKRIKTVAKMLDVADEILDFGVGWGDIIPYLLKRN